MPAQIEFFDMEASTTPLGWLSPIPVTLGPNWQPNDIRVFCNLWFLMFSDTLGDIYVGNQGIVPPGFTGIVADTTFAETLTDTNTNGSGGHQTYSVIAPGYGSISWRRLVAGDTDTFIQPTAAQWLTPNGAVAYATAIFTIRGVNPGYTPATGGLSWTNSPWDGITYTLSGQTDEWTQSTGLMSNQASSVTVPAAGTMVMWLSTTAIPTIGTYYPAVGGTTGCSMGVPTGWTPLVATANSGSTYYPYDTNDASQVIAKTYSSSGSTGTVTVPLPASINTSSGLLYEFYWNGAANVQGCHIFVEPAPDVTATAGSATTTNHATTASYSSSTLSANSAGNAFTTNTATTCFNATTGYWITDPFVLSGAPVTGSMVRWSAVTPPNTSVTVQTSINNGASWDLASANEPVPRLAEGDTTTQFVLAKVTMTRAAPTLFASPTVFASPTLHPSGSPPKLLSFELDVSTDTSVDELVPIGFGMVDKVTVHATAGTTGSGSSTNVAGSTGVIGQGGGQTGGGTAILVHVNDMSYAIKRNVWQMPYTVPSGENYGAAIQAMVLDRLPSQTAFNIVSTTLICPLLVYGVQQGGDPWQDIQELAQAIGYEAFFDAVGTFVCRPVPNPQTGVPVWVFDETAVQVISEAELELSSEQTFNDIVVVGQSTASANPFSAEAYDDNPASPTYVLGPYGRVSQRLIFSLITSQEQAQNTANVALYNSLGAAHTVTLTVVPMPALEPGDIIQVNCSNVNANGTYMINSMTTPLSPADPQQLVCFKQSTGS
jgi:hypothetical protein